MPTLPEDQFFGGASEPQHSFITIRVRTVKKLILALDVNIATGPDGISARILKELADVLAYPLAVLFRRMYREGRWPCCWRLHNVFPIFKKGSVYKASNYRGIHLTSNIAKVAERAIGNPLIAFLEVHGFGTNQWAFKKLSSARDLVLVCVSSWILSCCRGRKIVVYLSDIAGAFDRVYKDYLMGKLQQVGVSPTYLDFLNSYLEPRIGRVAIDGILSETFLLCDMVFQGTVLGPALWNTFFNDVASEATSLNGTDVEFADDLTVFKEYPLTISNENAMADMENSRKCVHKWGSRNRVTFAATKEHLLVLHPRHGEGITARFLGCMIDAQLNMGEEVEKLANQVRPKVQSLLCTRALYSYADLIAQYKIHVWSEICISYRNFVPRHSNCCI